MRRLTDRDVAWRIWREMMERSSHLNVAEAKAVADRHTYLHMQKRGYEVTTEQLEDFEYQWEVIKTLGNSFVF